LKTNRVQERKAYLGSCSCPEAGPRRSVAPAWKWSNSSVLPTSSMPTYSSLRIAVVTFCTSSLGILQHGECQTGENSHAPATHLDTLLTRCQWPTLPHLPLVIKTAISFLASALITRIRVLGPSTRFLILAPRTSDDMGCEESKNMYSRQTEKFSGII
jgi:hypothetical protein